MPAKPQRKGKRVFVNGFSVGSAKSWHEAEQRMWEFAELLFEHVGASHPNLQNFDKNKWRQNTFLWAMGVPEHANWEEFVDRDEVGDTYRFRFKRQ
jgi:hypothetical protein